jgi:HAMP domain-containing protein
MKTSNVAIIATATVASIALVAVVALVASAPKDSDVGLLIGVLITGAGGMITSILTLGRTQQIQGTVDELANGKMDAKIRAGVADVLADHLVDPKARAQVAQDREVRDSH